MLGPPTVETVVKEVAPDVCFVTFKVWKAYDIKEDLKKIGFRWNKADETWDYVSQVVKSENDTYVKAMTNKLLKLGCEFE